MPDDPFRLENEGPVPVRACQRAGERSQFLPMSAQMQTRLRKFPFVPFLFFLFLVPWQALGWGALGHRTIGEIAGAKLSPDARGRMDRLLDGQTLADVASWADEIRDGDGYAGSIWYHIEKIPDGVGYLDHLRAMEPRQRQKGGAVAAILVADRLLRDPDAAPSAQTDALKFLVHCVGDIHQPLHTGRPEDKGGLDTPVTWFGTPMSLHKVWDSGLLETAHPEFADLTVEKAGAAYAADLIQRFSNPPVNAEMDVEGWLNESLALRPAAYDPIYETDQAEYQARHVGEIDRQIYSAGIRLARMLNAIAAREPVPARETELWNQIEGLLGDPREIIRLHPAVAADAYPKEWWAPVPRESAAAWEILPQDAGPGEVILSKRTELGILSNFAPTPFALDGETYASVEGFWQMLKYPEGPGDERLRDPAVTWPHTRAQVAAMSAFEAKAAGTAANENMQKLGMAWVTYRGQKIDYREKQKGEFYQLIRRAEQAKLDQNPRVGEILRKTGDLKLRPDHHQAPDASPAMKYCEIWMELRAQLPE